MTKPSLQWENVKLEFFVQFDLQTVYIMYRHLLGLLAILFTQKNICFHFICILYTFLIFDFCICYSFVLLVIAFFWWFDTIDTPRWEYINSFLLYILISFQLLTHYFCYTFFYKNIIWLLFWSIVITIIGSYSTWLNTLPYIPTHPVPPVCSYTWAYPLRKKIQKLKWALENINLDL